MSTAQVQKSPAHLLRMVGEAPSFTTRPLAMPRPTLRPTTRRLPFAGLALALALATPLRTHAQTPVETGAVESTNARVFPFLGARFGVPQRLSFTAGMGFSLVHRTDPLQASHELLLSVAPGLGAERASVTYVYSTGRFGGGLAGGLSVLRTVHDPWQAPGNATYVGADFAVLPFIALGPRVGVYRRVSVPTADHPWLVALDFGFGF